MNGRLPGVQKPRKLPKANAKKNVKPSKTKKQSKWRATT